MSIGELADAAGLTRRTVRFYVQQKLLSPPHGIGRGRHYDAAHLVQLRRIAQYQAAGHSLEQIRQILGGQSVEALVGPPPAPAAGGRLRAEIWRRLKLIEGVELSFDASRFNPAVEDLLELREAIATVFRGREGASGDPPDGPDERD